MASTLLVRSCSIAILLFVIFPLKSEAATDPLDVFALRDLYMALNNSPKLKGWKADGGDPCGESWTGVACSGSSVIHIKLHGLELDGRLGSMMFNMLSLKHLDLSSNNIQGEIPFGLPPNATHINLASNKLTQNIPYSLSSIRGLGNLNLSHNMLSGPIGNVFTGLQYLKVMDLSYNNFTGDLPSSFSSLTNLTELFLQCNNFTGAVVLLANLPLTNLDIQDNHFSGIIPQHFQNIHNLWIGGNRFHVGDHYPPWDFPASDNFTSQQNITAPPTAESNAIEKYPSVKGHGYEKKGWRLGGIAFAVIGTALVAACAAIAISMHINRIRIKNLRDMDTSNSTVHSLPVSSTKDYSSSSEEESPHIFRVDSPLVMPRQLPPFPHVNLGRPSRRSFSRKCKMPPSAKFYTLAELQIATSSFSDQNFIGEGSLGSVYRAEFLGGHIFAVKNITMVPLSLYEEEQFLDVIRTASRLRHRNIVRLTGYCVDQGHHFVLYEYVRPLTLHDALHCENFMPLSWGLRLHIAFGISRALDYMHSMSPPIAHSNLKSANVLLDDELLPRVCDCGLGVLRPLTSNSVKLKASEMAISDSGYIAPEHGKPGIENTKADVYAFGVLLLELLTGMRPFDSSKQRGELSLAEWASSRLHDGDALNDMADSSLKRSINPKTLSRFADVISLCIQPEKEFRPPMSEIVGALASLLPRSGGIDGAEGDPLERSFRSTCTRFVGSPTMSHLSA